MDNQLSCYGCQHGYWKSDRGKGTYYCPVRDEYDVGERHIQKEFDISYCHKPCMEAPENPKLFEYDSKNKIIDVFVREDPECPYPFHWEDWYHQGFDLVHFMRFVAGVLEKANITSIFTLGEEHENILD